ncbi:MAG: hypothetical protein K9L78_03815 [Victivallales bacterium]|nr:hypothetical protein [Victivallales bacterium]MCF7889227.1 hypothetical protein [Victivallales bacterium]
MREVFNLLLIGAADRNVGKTELACSLIKKYKKDFNVIGIKITVIKQADGKCPRGGEGCGVCSSLKSEYCITEELNKNKPKDTSKMLNSGAARVYWLRVLKEHLSLGVDKLFTQIEAENGKDLCYICESNSARHAVKPGLFIVMKRKGSGYIKDSCKSILNYADMIVTFDASQKEYDISVDSLRFQNNRWRIKK